MASERRSLLNSALFVTLAATAGSLGCAPRPRVAAAPLAPTPVSTPEPAPTDPPAPPQWQPAGDVFGTAEAAAAEGIGFGSTWPDGHILVLDGPPEAFVPGAQNVRRLIAAPEPTGITAVANPTAALEAWSRVEGDTLWIRVVSHPEDPCPDGIFHETPPTEPDRAPWGTPSEPVAPPRDRVMVLVSLEGIPWSRITEVKIAFGNSPTPVRCLPRADAGGVRPPVVVG